MEVNKQRLFMIAVRHFLCVNFCYSPPRPPSTALPPPPLPAATPTKSNKNEDLFQTEEPVDLFGNEIEEEDKQTIYKSYV